MFLFCAAILYLIATILGVWGASLLWRAWHSWRLQRRGKRGLERPERVLSSGRRRFGVGVALISLPIAGVALSLGEIVRKGRVDEDPDFVVIAFQSLAGMLVFLAMGAVYVALRFDPSLGRRRCRRCWYDMSATQGRLCPECGFEGASEKEMFRTRRAPRLVIVAMLALVGAYAMYIAPGVKRNGWAAAVPTTALIVGLTWWPDEYIMAQRSCLAYRLEGEELWGWQVRLLRWRVERVIERSTDVNALGRVARFTWYLHDENGPRVRLSPKAQVSVLSEFQASLKTTGRGRFAGGDALLLLPSELAPEAAALVAPTIKEALTSGNPNPSTLHWGIVMAPTIGREADGLTPDLIAIARNTSLWGYTRFQAIRALARMGEWNDQAWTAYVAYLSDPDDEVRTQAVSFARHVKRYDEAIKSRLVAQLKDPSTHIAGLAASALVRISPDGCDVIGELRSLMKERPEVSAEIIEELARKCSSPEVVDTIRELLESDERRVLVGLAAASKLGAHGKALLPALRRLRDEDGVSYGYKPRVGEVIRSIEAAIGERGGAGR